MSESLPNDGDSYVDPGGFAFGSIAEGTLLGILLCGVLLLCYMVF